MNEPNLLVETLQESRGITLTEGEIAEVEQWQRGTKLRNLVNTEEWQIILDTLHSYVLAANADLMKLQVGDPTVLTAHAAASGVEQLYHLFKHDIEAAVAASYQTPYALTKQE